MESTKKNRQKYDLDDLSVAIANVKSGQMTAYRATKVYGIPTTTFYANLKGKKTNKLGKPTSLSLQEEKEIADWIIKCAERGYPRNRSDVMNAAQQMKQAKSKGI
jgi:helix-turn-helix, Psq domain